MKIQGHVEKGNDGKPLLKARLGGTKWQSNWQPIDIAAEEIFEDFFDKDQVSGG